MLRLEQLRGEVLERLERLDRRAGQTELRIVRIEQRVDDMSDCLLRLQQDITARLRAIGDLLESGVTLPK